MHPTPGLLSPVDLLASAPPPAAPRSVAALAGWFQHLWGASPAAASSAGHRHRVLAFLQIRCPTRTWTRTLLAHCSR